MGTRVRVNYHSLNEWFFARVTVTTGEKDKQVLSVEYDDLETEDNITRDRFIGS